jgi:hypothetical protein
MSKFKATENEWHNGFHITFKNGYTISVQFGKGNYSDKGETTAEIAAWGPDGEWMKLGEGDTVRGWCTPDEVLDYMKLVASQGSTPSKSKMSTFDVLRLEFYIALTIAVIITAIITLITA